MNDWSNWTEPGESRNDGHTTERPCPHCRGRWPEMDACIVCEGDGTVVLR
ncbi:hypothetical protein [Streptomyces sp. NPDC004528]